MSLSDSLDAYCWCYSRYCLVVAEGSSANFPSNARFKMRVKMMEMELDLLSEVAWMIDFKAFRENPEACIDWY